VVQYCARNINDYTNTSRLYWHLLSLFVAVAIWSSTNYVQTFFKVTNTWLSCICDRVLWYAKCKQTIQMTFYSVIFSRLLELHVSVNGTWQYEYKTALQYCRVLFIYNFSMHGQFLRSNQVFFSIKYKHSCLRIFYFRLFDETNELWTE